MSQSNQRLNAVALTTAPLYLLLRMKGWLESPALRYQNFRHMAGLPNGWDVR